jgi:ATP-binding cassette subfamily B protein/subfamily B ATP-binding cassette protein MsbA
VISGASAIDSSAGSSRQRYREFVEEYNSGRLDEAVDAAAGKKLLEAAAEAGPGQKGMLRGKRREYLREYVRWLWPHRYRIGVVFTFALVAAGIQMIEPLFMRFIIDKVLLNKALDTPARLIRLNLAGATFLIVITLSSVLGLLKDYRQRILNVRVMLSLRRSLFDRLLHLPLPKLWDMKTGGILSRLTGDVETTTGLLQMAIVSPALSIIRLVIGIGVLMTLNWRLALMAMAVIPVRCSSASGRRSAFARSTAPCARTPR